MSDELDSFIHSLGQQPRGSQVADGAFFMTSLRKLAAEEVVEEPAETEEPVEEMAAMAPDPVTLMAQAAAQAMRCQLNCLYYAEAVQGPDGEALRNVLRGESWNLRDDAAHLIRKIGVLTNGQGAPMPPVPSPEPASDAAGATQAVLACHQQYLVALQSLHQALEGDPSQLTIQQMLIRQQESVEKIQRIAPKGKAKTAANKLAAAVKIAVAKVAAAPKPSSDAVVVPPAGSEPMDQTAMREMALALQQSESEKAFLANRVQQAETSALENASAAENAQAEAQLTAETAEAASAQAQEATMQAQEAMTAATAAEENAASQAEAKMRLSMRIQQFRQQLADIVSQDPVAEEALDFGEIAGAGSPATANQQAAEQAAVEEEAMAAEAESSGGSKAKKEVNQAQRAQDEADQQAAQAQQAMGG